MANFHEINFLKRLVRRNKIIADEVVDVGVRAGTPSLYQSFPAAKFFLVDPQKGGESLLEERPQNFEFLNIGLGSVPGKCILNEQGGKSSVLERTPITAGKIIEKYEFEVSTLDNLIGERLHSHNIGLKIDTEGYELEIVKGLNDHCERVSFIIAEVSVRKRFVDSYGFHELVNALWDRGFSFYTVVSPPSSKPFHHDMLFLPISNPMLQ